MTGYVVDASVAVKWLVSEDYSEQAAGLLDGHSTLVAPDLLFAEERMRFGLCADEGTSPRRMLPKRWTR
jgi:predicted nucleic acid-binding protein